MFVIAKNAIETEHIHRVLKYLGNSPSLFVLANRFGSTKLFLNIMPNLIVVDFFNFKKMHMVIAYSYHVCDIENM